MTPTALAAAGDLISEVAEQLRENGPGMSDDDVLAALAATRELSRLMTQVQVETVAELQRRGTFAAFGYPKPDSAVATMLTVDRGRAREIVRAADHVSAAGTCKARSSIRCCRPWPMRSRPGRRACSTWT